MTVEDAQREVRTVFIGGLPGQAVSRLLWLTSAAVGTSESRRFAIEALAIWPVAVAGDSA